MANSGEYKTKGFEDLRVYQLSEKLSDIVWHIVVKWPQFAKRTVGNQLVRSADSIGANIAVRNGAWQLQG